MPNGLTCPLVKLFDMRSISTKAKRVARDQMNLGAIGGFDMRLIVETMTGIKPTIGSLSNGIDHAVSVARRIERPEQHFAIITLAIAIGILQVHDVRNAEADDAVGDWQDTIGMFSPSANVLTVSNEPLPSWSLSTLIES